jgi:hypothetical protein
MVDRERTRHGSFEQPLGIVTPTLQPVELAGQVERVLVGAPDAGDHPALPLLDGLVVAAVDRAQETAAVRRGPVVVRHPTGEGALVASDTVYRSPDGDLSSQCGGEDVVVVMDPRREGRLGPIADVGGERADESGTSGQVGTPSRVVGQLSWNAV